MKRFTDIVIAVCVSFYLLLPDTASALMKSPLAIASQALLVSYAAKPSGSGSNPTATLLIVGGGGGGGGGDEVVVT